MISSDSIETLVQNNIANQGSKKGLVNINIVNLRDFAKDSYKKIDDCPESIYASALLNGPPRNGPIGYLLGQAVRTTNNYSLNGGTSPCH